MISLYLYSEVTLGVQKNFIIFRVAHLQNSLSWTGVSSLSSGAGWPLAGTLERVRGAGTRCLRWFPPTPSSRVVKPFLKQGFYFWLSGPRGQSCLPGPQRVWGRGCLRCGQMLPASPGQLQHPHSFASWGWCADPHLMPPAGLCAHR